MNDENTVGQNRIAKQKDAHLDTTTNIRGSAERNAAFTLQYGAMLTPRQPEGCVPVVVSRCAQQKEGKMKDAGMSVHE